MKVSSATPVTCIMPTANRRRFVPLAIRYFLAQDYPKSELLILDDGEDAISDLVPADPRVRYVRETRRRVLGDKRNALCDLAAGEVIVHWDDDDWSSPHRVSVQAAALATSGADACGIDRILFLADGAREGWEYTYPRGGAPWVYGASLCYTKEFWRRNRFAEVSTCEDTHFIWADRNARIHEMPDNAFMVALVHGGNTCRKQVRDRCWRQLAPATLAAIVGPDWIAYTGDGATPTIGPALAARAAADCAAVTD